MARNKIGMNFGVTETEFIQLWQNGRNSKNYELINILQSLCCSEFDISIRKQRYT